jgi:hypothetical protein
VEKTEFEISQMLLKLYLFLLRPGEHGRSVLTTPDIAVLLPMRMISKSFIFSEKKMLWRLALGGYNPKVCRVDTDQFVGKWERQ